MQEQIGRPATPEEMITALARKHQVNPALAIEVARRESGLDQSKLGDSGMEEGPSVGMFQLRPGTARDMGVDANDLVGNITGGVKYLKMLSDRYKGDVHKTLTAYNGGLGNVDKGTVSPEADTYAREVIGAIGRTGAKEREFQSWYANHAKNLGINPDPDAPDQFYDYRAAHEAGAEPDADKHWPSEFKREGHPRMVVNGINTKTGEPVNDKAEVVTDKPSVNLLKQAARSLMLPVPAVADATADIANKIDITAREKAEIPTELPGEGGLDTAWELIKGLATTPLRGYMEVPGAMMDAVSAAREPMTRNPYREAHGPPQVLPPGMSEAPAPPSTSMLSSESPNLSAARGGYAGLVETLGQSSPLDVILTLAGMGKASRGLPGDFQFRAPKGPGGGPVPTGPPKQLTGEVNLDPRQGPTYSQHPSAPPDTTGPGKLVAGKSTLPKGPARTVEESIQRAIEQVKGRRSQGADSTWLPPADDAPMPATESRYAYGRRPGPAIPDPGSNLDAAGQSGKKAPEAIARDIANKAEDASRAQKEKVQQERLSKKQEAERARLDAVAERAAVKAAREAAIAAGGETAAAARKRIAADKKLAKAAGFTERSEKLAEKLAPPKDAPPVEKVPTPEAAQASIEEILADVRGEARPVEGRAPKEMSNAAQRAVGDRRVAEGSPPPGMSERRASELLKNKFGGREGVEPARALPPADAVIEPKFSNPKRQAEFDAAIAKARAEGKITTPKTAEQQIAARPKAELAEPRNAETGQTSREIAQAYGATFDGPLAELVDHIRAVKRGESRFGAIEIPESSFEKLGLRDSGFGGSLIDDIMETEGIPAWSTNEAHLTSAGRAAGEPLKVFFGHEFRDFMDRLDNKADPKIPRSMQPKVAESTRMTPEQQLAEFKARGGEVTKVDIQGRVKKAPGQEVTPHYKKMPPVKPIKKAEIAAQPATTDPVSRAAAIAQQEQALWEASGGKGPKPPPKPGRAPRDAADAAEIARQEKMLAEATGAAPKVNHFEIKGEAPAAAPVAAAPVAKVAKAKSIIPGPVVPIVRGIGKTGSVHLDNMVTSLKTLIKQERLKDGPGLDAAGKDRMSRLYEDVRNHAKLPPQIKEAWEAAAKPKPKTTDTAPMAEGVKLPGDDTPSTMRTGPDDAALVEIGRKAGIGPPPSGVDPVTWVRVNAVAKEAKRLFDKGVKDPRLIDEMRRFWGATETARRLGLEGKRGKAEVRRISGPPNERRPLIEAMAEMEARFKYLLDDPSGFMRTEALVAGGAAAAGGAVGFTFDGESVEDKWANAAAMAMVSGALGFAGARGLVKAKKSMTRGRTYTGEKKTVGSELKKHTEGLDTAHLLAGPAMLKASLGSVGGIVAGFFERVGEGRMRDARRGLRAFITESPGIWLKTVKAPASELVEASKYVETQATRLGQAKPSADNPITMFVLRPFIAADRAGSHALKRMGFSADESARMMLMGAPTSWRGQSALRLVNSMYTTRMLMKFPRVRIIGLERAIEYTPILSKKFGHQVRSRHSPEGRFEPAEQLSERARRARAIYGGGLMAGGTAYGFLRDPEVLEAGIVSSLAGPAYVPAAAGMAFGKGLRKGGAKAIAAGLGSVAATVPQINKADLTIPGLIRRIPSPIRKVFGGNE